MPYLSDLCNQILSTRNTGLARQAIREQHPEWINAHRREQGEQVPIRIDPYRGRNGWLVDLGSEAARNEFENFLRSLYADNSPANRPGIRIGADPEWLLCEENDYIYNASRLWNNSYSPRLHSQIGTDGCASTGEFRPRPGTGEQVTKNIKKLISSLNKRLKEQRLNLRLFAGAGRNSAIIGGHIHFSGRPSSPQLLDALDHFVSSPLNAHSECAAERIRSGYGRYGVTRSQPHGWEYRSPLSWIMHPIITEGVLTIAYWLANQSDIQLEALLTQDILLRVMPEREGNIAREFYAFLNNLRDPLERIEVFAAWGLRNPTNTNEVAPAAISSPIVRRRRGRPLGSRNRTTTAPRAVNMPRRGRGRPRGSRNRSLVAFNRADDNMQLIAERLRGLRCRIPMRIIGANITRTSASTIFVPQNLLDSTNDNNYYGQEVPISTWSLPAIGLSFRLRESPSRAVLAIRALIDSINRRNR